MPISYTGQAIIDSIRVMPDLAPVFQSQVSGFSLEPGLTIINDTMNYMLSPNFPWKFNEIEIPPFYINSYQQDYASNVTGIGYLQAGDCLDVNNTVTSKPMPQVRVVRDLPRTSTWVSMPPMFYGPMIFNVCWLYNSSLYFGTWGAANSGSGTRGNNPLAGSVYANPLSSGNAMPSNPITQIKDANGNLLVLTGYGTEGSTAPLAPVGAAAGTNATPGAGATTQWTVVDPEAQGFRIAFPPAQTGVVWQFNLRAQGSPTQFTSLDTKLAPVPDDYIPTFRQGAITMSYRYSPEEKVRQKYGQEIQLWNATLMQGRMQGDREQESYSMVPSGGVVASISGVNGVITPGNPFGNQWG